MKTKFIKKSQHEASLKLNDNLLWGNYKVEINSHGQNKAEVIHNLIDTLNCFSNELIDELSEMNEKVKENNI